MVSKCFLNEKTLDQNSGKTLILEMSVWESFDTDPLFENMQFTEAAQAESKQAEIKG